MQVHTYASVRSFGVSLDWISRAATQLARGLQLPKKSSISVVCIGQVKMRTLHRLYSGDATVTDVLSFPANESYDGKWRGVADETELGEVFICIPQAKRQAKIAGHSLKEEIVILLAHGLLHLIGHDHGTKVQARRMYALQDKLVRKVK